MEEQSVQEIIKATYWPRTMAPIALGALALFLLVLTMGELKSYSYIGSGVAATNTITVSGKGDVFAVPDTATFSVTVQEQAQDVKAAQDAATKKSNDIIAYLKGAGIAEKDIQTTDYSVNPQYQWTEITCVRYPCPPGKQTLTGFQVSQTLTIKVRDTKKAGDFLSGVGSRGAFQVSGLSFTIDDQDALEAQARGKAIDDARTKAEALAKQLGVTLVRIVGFSENGNYPGPVYMKSMAVGMGGAEAAPSPDIPVGQNKITSNVSVTYEVR
jgi:hypothetical protein